MLKSPNEGISGNSKSDPPDEIEGDGGRFSFGSNGGHTMAKDLPCGRCSAAGCTIESRQAQSRKSRTGRPSQKDKSRSGTGRQERPRMQFPMLGSLSGLSPLGLLFLVANAGRNPRGPGPRDHQRRIIRWSLAVLPGFEPRRTESESVVLPLHYRTIGHLALLLKSSPPRTRTWKDGIKIRSVTITPRGSSASGRER